MRIGTVVVSAPDARYWATTKSSIDSANDDQQARRHRRHEQRQQHAPHDLVRRRAEVGRRLLDVAARSSTSRPRTISTTQDIENVTCPITCAVVPSPMNVNAVVKSRNMPTANTSSGVTSGSSISTFDRAGAGPRQRCSPSASAVPSGTAISIASAASIRLCSSALPAASGRGRR